MTRKQKSSAKLEGRPVWAEVSASALTYNLRAIRAYVNPADDKRKTPRLVLSIVKGNGYGHGGPRGSQDSGEGGFGLVRRDLHRGRHRGSQGRCAQADSGADEFLAGRRGQPA